MSSGTFAPRRARIVPALSRLMAGDRLALLMGFSLLPFFAAAKAYLYLWYRWSEGADPLEAIAAYQLPLLFASDALLCLVLSVFYLGLLMKWRMFSPSRTVPLLAMLAGNAAVIVFTAVSVKINQVYGTPLLVLHLRMADDLVTMRDSILSNADIHVAAVFAMGLAALALVVRCCDAFRNGWERTRVVAWPVLVAATALLAAGALKTLGGTYVYGLKKNALVNFVRYYEPLPEAHDLRALARELRLEVPRNTDWFAPRLLQPVNHGPPADLTGEARGNNLVLIVLESTADAFIDAETTPNLHRLREKSIVFDRFYTTAVNSFRANYSIFYSDHVSDVGRYGHPRDIYGGPPPGPSLLESAGEQSMHTAVFFSGLLGYTDIGYLWRDKGARELYGANDILRKVKGNGWVWGAHETQTVKVMGEWLKQERGQPFLAVYLTAYPHHPYHTPGADKRFPEDTWRNRYRNSLHYVDRNIGELLRHLERTGLRSTTSIAVVGDHGQTLDGVRAGHGIRMDLDEMQVPFFIHNPGRPGSGTVRSTPANLLDLAPTLMANLGLAAPDAWLGRNLLSGTVAPRRLYVHRNANNAQSAIIEGAQVYVRDEASGRNLLYRRGADGLEPYPETEAVELLGEAYAGLEKHFESWTLLRHLDRACGASRGQRPFCGPGGTIEANAAR